MAIRVNYGVLGTNPSLSRPCESPDRHCWPPPHNQMLFQLDGASKFSALSQCYYSCLTRPAPPSGRHGPLVPYSKGLTSSCGSRHYCLRPYPPIMTEPGADWAQGHSPPGRRFPGIDRTAATKHKSPGVKRKLKQMTLSHDFIIHS